MTLRSKTLTPALVLAAGWAAVAALAGWYNRPSPLPAGAPAQNSILVRVAAGSPAARDWAHFFACSGLSGDAQLMRSTLLLNNGGDEAFWRLAAGQEAVVRLALVPAPGDLAVQAEQIISGAPRAVADCGVTP